VFVGGAAHSMQRGGARSTGLQHFGPLQPNYALKRTVRTKLLARTMHHRPHGRLA